ncbi:hypothetical protein ACIO13_23125 [Streptomyces sp. NPDC087425]|uniref:hypothetical protein n=1 Tax=Streptomyces sp. NPDC087425 TaxID=3365787 RepID=UPI0037FEECC4
MGRTRVEGVLKTDVRQWAEAGCRGVWLGAESLSVAGTGAHERVTEQQIKDVLLKVKEAGSTPFAFVLIGLSDGAACWEGRLVDRASELPG